MTFFARYDIEWLKQEVERGSPLKFLYFWGNHEQPGTKTKACLSQWYYSPFIVKGVTYRTAEHWMMAKKALWFGVKVYDEE